MITPSVHSAITWRKKTRTNPISRNQSQSVIRLATNGTRMNARTTSSTTTRNRRLRRWPMGGIGGRFDPRLTAATFRQEMWSLSGAMESAREWGRQERAAPDNPDHGGATQPCEARRLSPGVTCENNAPDIRYIHDSFSTDR